MTEGRPPLEIVFVGTGNAFAPRRYWSSFLLNGKYLFDCGPATLAQIKMLGRRPRDIETVFISHFHADHYFGLPFLFLDYGELDLRQSELTVVGPPRIEAVSEELYRRAYPGVSAHRVDYHRRYIEIEEGKEFQVGDVRFRAYRVEHTESLECFGFKVWVDGRVLGYTGDTALCDAVYEIADGVEILVIDCTYPSGHNPHHLSFEEVTEIRGRLPATTTMILTHMDAEQTDGGLPGVVAARDFGHYYFR